MTAQHLDDRILRRFSVCGSSPPIRPSLRYSSRRLEMPEAMAVLVAKLHAAYSAVIGWLVFSFRSLFRVLHLGTISWYGVPFFRDRRSLLPVYSATSLRALEDPLDKLTVVLDLDETLVSARLAPSLPATLRDQAIEAGVKCFDMEFLVMDEEVEENQKKVHLTILERPGLQEFLYQISEFAYIVLYTAAHEDYARPVVDRIDADNRFIHRLYRPATINTKYSNYVKDLSLISEDLSRIVIVDNNPFSFLLQPRNGIPCVPFNAEEYFDKQLMEVILPLLKRLSLAKDVRPLLYKRFRMPEWFEKHGIPSSWMHEMCGEELTDLQSR
ncbi:carboxy-terminal domain RNA polymerase II polypeptide A small phosphatase 1 [Canna indica]|uniref:Carboxy-terminal domain RNA polymerase II polypeptide A small phosphatase 1 n=1 Tax=Canna indica TaxID=4628 RepID=A0AAQ3L5M7_9LILI|nr:carboxy-terminal domain RNA polymerase II polypeptide A small phosphatase 1 [Canna indica]